MKDTVIVDLTLFAELSRRLLDQVRGLGKRYRAVLSPLTGGFYISHFMSRHLGIPMVFIEITSYRGRERREFHIGSKPDLQRDVFLLCDDVYDSGRTIEKIKSLYPHVHFDTACLVSKVKDAPILAGMRVEPDVWIEFFWEIL